MPWIQHVERSQAWHTCCAESWLLSYDWSFLGYLITYCWWQCSPFFALLFAQVFIKIHRLETTQKNRESCFYSLFSLSTLFFVCRVYVQCTAPRCNLTQSQSAWLGTGVLSHWLRNLTSLTRCEKQIFHFGNLYIITSVLSGKLMHTVVCLQSQTHLTDGDNEITCASTLSVECGA